MTSPLGARLQVRPSQLPTRGNRAQSLPAPSPSPSPSFPTLHSSAAPRTSPRSAIVARVVDLAVGRPAPSTSLLGARLQILDRREKIELLVGKTETLRSQADSFHRHGRELRRKMWLQNLRFKLMVFVEHCSLSLTKN